MRIRVFFDIDPTTCYGMPTPSKFKNALIEYKGQPPDPLQYRPRPGLKFITRTKYQIRRTAGAKFAFFAASCRALSSMISSLVVFLQSLKRKQAPGGREREKMPFTHIMSEICNLAYLIVENIIEEQYSQRRNNAGQARGRRRPQRPHPAPDGPRKASRPPKQFQHHQGFNR